MRLVTFKPKVQKPDSAAKMREYRAAYEERNRDRPARKRAWYLANRALCIKRAGESKRRRRAKVDLLAIPWKVAT